MKFDLKTWTLIIYLSFAFDSLLKLNMGVQLHIGICAILLTNVVFLLTSPNKTIAPLKRDYSFSILIVYCFLNGIYFSQPGFLSILTYLIIATNVMIYCANTFRFLDGKVLHYFQVIMIITGIGQYLSFKLFGIQLSFINAEHYEKGSSVSYRLRGFFIEPNWFAISFAFNTLLLIKTNIIAFIKENKVLFLATVLTIILNGSLTTIAILVVIYTLPLMKKSPAKGALVSVLMISVLAGVFSFRGAINQKDDNDSILNQASRWIPITRVIDFYAEKNYENLLIGHGLGSWGTVAVKNRLSVLVYDIDDDARDGSETPVILFELGLIGLIIIIWDSLRLFLKCPRSEFHIRGGIILFIACLAFYPTLKFWMYMPYYFYMRRIAYEPKPLSSSQARPRTNPLPNSWKNQTSQY
ncbi:hypothetical protein PSJE_07120 [Pseudomonas jessenii]|uniref:Uncharacterized protein n=2 Tax=Pseudomonas TaxID=286 RepID=A0A231GP57_PSEJE|nr:MULTISPECIES: hypothetical protein [Pseudomonas]OXR38261.1 hypothetical protein PSJE_07120 [Pseudomonas jessenii]SEC03490.1 hypothetical protein SAMN04490187_2910 [Pseudomonas jessenii]VVP74165.1 hypothetical protein PS922_01165 [Pseudomonas fluorescens]